MATPSQIIQSRRLVFLGLVLFLLALIVGFFVQYTANPRMALSAHLEGILNGLFLLVLGLIWEKLVLSPRWLGINFALVLYGAFANFLAVLIAACSGSSAMMPIAGGEHRETVWDGVIFFLLVSLSLAMVAVCLITLAGWSWRRKTA